MPEPPDVPEPNRETAQDATLDDPIAYRDLSERLPNEALRDELEHMTAEEQDEYLRRLEELARIYLGPGGP
jgi:hypothetical protein